MLKFEDLQIALGGCSNQLAKAIALAALCHVNQVDKGGKPYILHPLRVMHRLRTDDEELMCIAVLHDVVEDCDITLEQLLLLGFTQRVVDGVKLLSNLGDISYDEFIRQIGTSYDATRVKLEDIKDNSDITRLKGIREKDFDRMIKYQKAFVYLKSIKHEVLM